MSDNNISVIEKFFRSIQRFFNRKNYMRLYGAMRTYRNELEYFANKNTAMASSQVADKDWLTAAYKLLEEAEYALAKNQIQVGWQCLHSAIRMSIFGYSNDRIQQAAIAIHNEATNKFSIWRKNAIDEMLGVKTKTAAKAPVGYPCSFMSGGMAGGIPAAVIPGGASGSTIAASTPETPPLTPSSDTPPDSALPGGGAPGITSTGTPSATLGVPTSSAQVSGVIDSNVSADSLYVATILRDEHFENIHYKITLRRANLLGLFIVLVCGLIALPVLAYMGFFPAIMGSWQMIIAVQLFGIFGACMSVALTLTGKSIDSDIPDQQIGSFITWMRPALGAIAAIAAYILLQAGFLDSLINSNLKTNFIGIMAISFISGFSERLVIGVIERVAKK